MDGSRNAELLRQIRLAAYPKAQVDLPALLTDAKVTEPAERLVQTHRDSAIGRWQRETFKRDDACAFLTDFGYDPLDPGMQDEIWRLQIQYPGFEELADRIEAEEDKRVAERRINYPALGRYVRKHYPDVATFWVGPVIGRAPAVINGQAVPAALYEGLHRRAEVTRADQYKNLGAVTAFVVSGLINPLSRSVDAYLPKAITEATIASPEEIVAGRELRSVVVGLVREIPAAQLGHISLYSSAELQAEHVRLTGQRARDSIHIEP